MDMQEYVFHMGDRNLGSFFMSSKGEPSPEPIHQRLITAPTKTHLCGQLTLLYVEETAGTMVWTADTPEEAAEGQRLYDAARGRDGSRSSEERPAMISRSPEEWELIRAVLNDFQDDVPLLAYADWLTSQGSSQGEFIRVDREIDRTAPDDPRFTELNDRWSDLHCADIEKWFEPLTALNLFPYERIFWIDRGLICEVGITDFELLTERAEELFAAVPFLRRLSFDCESVNIDELADIPQMAQIAALELGYLDVLPDQLETLLNSPYLSSLVELDLDGNDDGTDLVRVLVDSPVWPRLSHLSLRSCDLDDEGLRLIADSEQSQLRELRLSGDSITSTGLAALGRMTHSRLELLDLEGVNVSAAGIAAIRDANWVAQLRSLTLKSLPIDKSFAAELAELPLQALQQFDLRFSKLDDECVSIIFSAGRLLDLEDLDLSYNLLTHAGIESLLNSPVAVHLRNLKLNSNAIGTKGISAIAMSHNLKRLQTLELYCVDLDSEAAEILASSQGLPRNTRIWLGDENRLTDADRERLIARFGEETIQF